MAGEGKKVMVKEILAGFRLRKRLSDMGIYEGTEVAIVRNDVSGPVIIGVLDSKVVLGRGEAHKIMVE